MRGVLYLATMMAIIAIFGLIMKIVCFCFNIDLQNSEFWIILLFSAVFGFGGSMVSLFASKFLVKKSMKVQLITSPTDSESEWLLKTVSELAQKKGVKIPEVGIYPADEMNAFATGWNKNAALVCVSRGILKRMKPSELEAVLGHEMSHVSNGDMVTSCMLQGIMNTFVYALSMVVARVISAALNGKNSSSSSGMGSAMVYHLVQGVLQTVFGFVATIIVMWFSRWREYRADAGAAEVYGKEAMIQALKALEHNVVSKKSPNVAALCISGSLLSSELFMTHPTIQHRIEALQKLSK